MPVVLKSLFIGTSLVLLALVCEDGLAAADVRRPDASPQPAMSTGSGVRPFSRQEIFQAIESGLARRQISGRGELRAEDLTIQSPTRAHAGDAGLELKKLGFDRIRQETVFQLWTSLEPQNLPFEVTTRRDPRTWGFIPPGEGGHCGGDSDMASTRAADSSQEGPLLAKPGRVATLVMLGQNVRVTTAAIPLQPGRAKDRILVRVPDTRRIVRAEVVNTDLLQVGL
jgi:hypothetical protein